MLELSNAEMRSENRKSSKGNQMKWLKEDHWYKADYTGYEGLAEYIVSNLLKYSNLEDRAFQIYTTEKIKYNHAEFVGCKSDNFLPERWQMITLERLFLNYFGHGLHKSIYTISNLEERIKFLVNQTERITGLQNFGDYMCRLITLDAFFLNEDRHTHNIAVLLDEEGKYQYCPIFDNGGCLLSDTTLDYPLNIDIETLIQSVESKTFTNKFDDQLDAIEKLYGLKVKFSFILSDIHELLEKEMYYPAEIKQRVEAIMRYQMRKYAYLFK